MPSVPTTSSKEVIALFVADLHLSHKPPLVRIGEKNWYAVMGEALSQITLLKDKYQCSVIVAGDVFDNGWNPHKCPPELINFAIANLPRCYAIPGQHDLPYHRYDHIDKSAYWTLASTGEITNLQSCYPVEIPTVGGRVLRLHGFPWGTLVEPLNRSNHLCIEIAVIHEYVWVKGCSYPNASQEHWLGNVKKELKGYDICVFGDNHQSFDFVTEDTRVYNCGAFMRRRLDEKDHKPSVGLLCSDLTIKRHYLDISKDVFDATPREGKKTSSIDPSELIGELKSLGNKVLDFTEALERLQASGQIEDDVWQIILSALENKT